MLPFLRWAGSKRPIVSTLLKYYPGSPARYVEPFAGSACLFFALEPKDAVLGDLNLDLIATLRQLQRNADGVIHHLAAMPVGSDAYYRVRDATYHEQDASKRAARFIYLNHYCFNGLYRTNRDGRFNVPYGPPKSGLPLAEDLLQAASMVLRRAALVHADFEDTLDFARRGDFVYLDPPYATASRRVFAEYHPSAFSGKDLARLKTALHRLDSRGIRFVATYADSPEGRELFRPWRRTRIWTRRNIAGFEGHRRGTYEILATNIHLGAGSR